MLISILIGVIAWIVFGYFESFQFNLGSDDLNQLIAIWRGVPEMSTILNLFVQLDFFLYAVVMFSGSIVPQFSWKFFAVFVPLWLLLVYGPLANLIWSTNGWLNRIGALDFSGGLVVHLTAGLTSLVVARFIARPNEKMIVSPVGNTNHYTAMVLIFVGWFGFNLAPLGQLNHLAGLIILNTILAVLFATVGWGMTTYHSQHHLSVDDMINGVICGLVTSTALVGYVSPVAISVTALISGMICWLVTQYCHRTTRFYDAVDSFSINAIGGLVGTVGLILFANKGINPSGATGLIFGNTAFGSVELLAIVVTAIITIVGTYIAYLGTKVVIDRFTQDQEEGEPIHVKSV